MLKTISSQKRNQLNKAIIEAEEEAHISWLKSRRPTKRVDFKEDDKKYEEEVKKKQRQKINWKQKISVKNYQKQKQNLRLG